MSLPIQIALTVGPLACYFYVVGIWQSGRHPRVIPGAVDFSVLAFGVSGLLTVGPVGRILMELVFGTPSPMAWALWLLFLALWTAVFASSAARRLVVYNLRPEQLTEAVRASLPDDFHPKLGGFESTTNGQAVHVESIASLRVGTVDARGKDPETLIRELRRRLRERLRDVPAGPTRVAWSLFLVSWITMLAPLLVFLATEPKAREAVRALWMRITGGA